MKEVKKEQSIIAVETVYVSYDGKEFRHRQSCLEYEREFLSTQHKEQLEKMQYKELDDMCPFCAWEFHESYEHRWYKPMCSADIRLLQSIYPTIKDFDDFYIGKIICCSHYDCADFVSVLDDEIDYVKKVLGKLGYGVEIKDVDGKIV